MSTLAEGGTDISPADMARRIYRFFHNKRFGLWLIFAMTFLSLMGVLFQQVPADVRADPVKYQSFLDQMQPTYRGWTMPLSVMGFFHMFSSWPFRIVNILLVLSIIACTTHRLPTLWKNATRPRTHVREGFFDHARTHVSRVVPGRPGEAHALLEEARGKLARQHYRVLVDENDPDSLNLYADKFRFMPLGTALAHAAFVLILLGVLITNNTGFQDDEFVVPVGMDPVAVGHGTGLSVKAYSFTDKYHDDGSPMDYAADVEVLRDGKPVKRHILRVNEPLTVDGIKMNQSYFGFAADLTVKDQAGKEVIHQGVALQYSTQDRTQNYGKVVLPTGQQLYVVQPASGQVDAEIGPGQVRVELYQPDSDQPQASQVIDQGRPTPVGDLVMTFNRERQFTGLMVGKDNGAPFVWVGSLLLVAGMICTMFFRHQRLWVRIHPGADGNQVRVASPDKHDTLFERKVGEFVDHLGTPGAPGATTPTTPTTDSTTSGSTHA